MKSLEQYSLGGCSFYCLWEYFMRNTVQTASDGITCVPNFMKIDSGIQVILTVWWAILLVLLMRGICYVRHWDWLRYMIYTYIRNFMKIGGGVQVILIAWEIWKAVMLVLLMEEIYYLSRWDSSFSMIFLRSFLKIDAGVQLILRFCLSNLNGCNIGITDVN
jgi:hypothetical protein